MFPGALVTGPTALTGNNILTGSAVLPAQAMKTIDLSVVKDLANIRSRRKDGLVEDDRKKVVMPSENQYSRMLENYIEQPTYSCSL